MVDTVYTNFNFNFKQIYSPFDSGMYKCSLYICISKHLNHVVVKCIKVYLIYSICQNAELGGIPHFEHDENLFLDKREQMVYNVEDRQRVESKYNLPPRSKMLRPDFTHPTSKYQSSLMFRRDNKKEAL